MQLNEIKFGIGNYYYCSKHHSECYVVNCFYDDGASLIIELIDNDLTSKYRMTEASHLTPLEDKDN